MNPNSFNSCVAGGTAKMKILKIYEDTENKCLICGNKFRHLRVNKITRELKDIGIDEICVTRFVLSHAKCRRILENYNKAKSDYEWAKFEYNLLI
jgi:hypothetical protein